MKKIFSNRKFFRRKIKPVDVITVLFLGLMIVLSLLGYNFFKQELTEEIITFGLFGLVIFIFLIEFIPQFIGPHIPIIFAISSGINVHLVIVFSVIATTLGSVAGFYIGERRGIFFMCVLFREKTLMKVFRFWSSYGHMFVLLSALIPLPYFPLVFGSLGMSRKDFIKFGIIPRVIGFVIIGYAFYFGIEGIKYLLYF